MIDFKNNYVFSSIIGIIGTCVILYLYRDNTETQEVNKDINYTRIFHIFILITSLVLATIYLKSSNILQKQSGGNFDSNLSNNVEISDPHF